LKSSITVSAVLALAAPQLLQLAELPVVANVFFFGVNFVM
jgi:hypothetical protein